MPPYLALPRFETIEKWIKDRKAITFINVKRDCNKVVDLLANIGTDQDQILHYSLLDIIDDQNQLQICTDLV